MPPLGKPISTKILTVFPCLLVWFITLALPLQSIGQIPDTIKVFSPDSTLFQKTDTVPSPFSDELKSKVNYTADDSIKFDIRNEKVYLYGNAVIKYEDLELKAAYVEIDWSTRNVIAKGVPDSSGLRNPHNSKEANR